MQKVPLFLLSTLIAFATASGDITLPALISDNMLLQQPQSAVWGKADPGEQVKVKLGKVVAKTTADPDGNWRVKLDGLTPGLAGSMTVSGKNTLTIQNVAVGDVWVCSGQSNMEVPVLGMLNDHQEIAAANYPQLRMFTVPRTGSETPLAEVDGKWEVCTPETVSQWSATGYYFGRQLHQDLKTPIGLLHASWGGTLAQHWTPSDCLEGDAELKAAYYDYYHQTLRPSYPAAKEKYDKETLPAWQAAADAAKIEGKPEPQKPKPPRGGPSDPTISSALYNAMIAGATKFPIKGAIWYQGESNTNDSVRYHRLLPAMINGWRKAWNQGDFPFYIVQLANFMDPKPEDNWADLREAQRLTAENLPNAGLAVAIDIGGKGIHPLNKQEVGRRLALVAEAKTYGKRIVYSGPAFTTAQFEGANVKINFKPGTASGLAVPDGAPIKGFAVAGEDKKFVWAEAKIVPGDAPAKEPVVVLSSPQVAKPVAVRYAWANNPEVNLVNQAGLPAVPFRTDAWPQIEPPKTSPTPAPAKVSTPATAPK